MKRTTLALALLSIGAVGSAQAASFLNGGFEDGNFGSWTQGAGRVTNPTATATGDLALNPSLYAPSGASYNAGYLANTITNVGYDPTLGGTALSTVKYGQHSARINDWNNNYSVSTISQSVSAYSGSSINFAWAAVLESSHGITDSDIFGLKITDKTTNTVLYNVTYSSANTSSSPAGTFKSQYVAAQGSTWFYTDWQEISLNVTQGHDFEVSLLAADCPYGGHAGYVYLDGFGVTQGGPGDNGNPTNVPEPGTLALAGLGLVAAAGLRRRKSV